MCAVPAHIIKIKIALSAKVRQNKGNNKSVKRYIRDQPMPTSKLYYDLQSTGTDTLYQKHYITNIEYSILILAAKMHYKHMVLDTETRYW